MIAAMFYGLGEREAEEVEANLIRYNELEVTGTMDSRRSDYETARRLIESGWIGVRPMVTHRFP